MNHRLVSRLLSIVLIGIVVGALIHRQNEKWRHLGREAYIDHELADFNANIAEPQSKPVLIIAGVFVAATFFGLYEAVVFLFAAILKRVYPPAANQQRTATPNSFPFG